MKLFTSHNGAVSVFLVIILVPTLVVTGIFVDASRMVLGKSVAESAGDLALNSQLSQFDGELNDIYGLFANAKDANEVTGNLNKFFNSCLVSAGVETTDASRYGAILSDLVDDEFGEEYSDLLRIDTVGDAAISTVKGGNLGNPQVLKNQIVDFMKYRGPVDIVQNILGRMTKIKDQIDITDDETEVTDKMNDYYESENVVLNHLYDAYQKIKDYRNNGNITEEYINGLKQKLSSIESEYKNHHKKMFKDLYNTQGVNIQVDTTTIPAFQTLLKNKSYKEISGMTKETAKKNYDKYVRNAKTSINNFKTVYDKFKGLFDTYVKSYAHNTQIYPYELNSNIYPVQWYVALSKEANVGTLSQLKGKAKTMTYNVARAYKASKLLEDKETEDYKAMINSYKPYVENPNKSYNPKTYDQTGSLYVINAYFEPFKTLINKVYNNEFKNATGQDKINAINSYMSATASSLKSDYNKINEAKKIVTAANKFLKSAKDELTKKGGTNDKYNSWGSTLNKDVFKNQTSEVHKSSTEAREDQDTKEFREKVTEQSISDLMTRLTNIETLLTNMMSLIDSFKYNGYSVKNIDSYNKFKSKSKIDKNNIVIDKTTLENNANSSFNFSSNSLDTVKVNSTNHPDLENSSPALYLYLKYTFPNTAQDTKDKKSYETLKKKNKEDTDVSSAETTDKLSDKEIGSKSEETQKVSKGIKNISNKITSMFNGIGNAISNPTAMRDDLYILDYVMNMFSYHTYNKEGIYNMALAEGVSGLDNLTIVKNLGGKTSSEHNTTYSEAWKNDQKTFKENKTLTNHMINLNNNYSFGNEIEYILNGKTISSNKSAVFGKIFMLRYAFNLGPEFAANWSNGELISLANSINALCPFIPAALVKTVVILALTALEATSDLTELKQGMKVMLVKPKNKLKYVFSADCLEKLVNDQVEAKSGGGTPASELKGINYMQYSDYLSIFLFIDLFTSSDDNVIMNRIGEVIGRNIGVAKGYSNTGDEVFKMDEAHTYYCFTAKIKIDPLILSLPLLSDERFNKSSSVSWWKWDYSIIRGYS